MEQFPQYTHYGWIKMDYLSDPYYHKQAFNWEGLKDDNIHLGVRCGKIDEGLFIVPEEKSTWFLQELEEYEKEGKTLTTALEGLVDRNPHLFSLYDYDENHHLLEAFLYK